MHVRDFYITDALILFVMYFVDFDIFFYFHFAGTL